MFDGPDPAETTKIRWRWSFRPPHRHHERSRGDGDDHAMAFMAPTKKPDMVDADQPVNSSPTANPTAAATLFTYEPATRARCCSPMWFLVHGRWGTLNTGIAISNPSAGFGKSPLEWSPHLHAVYERRRIAEMPMTVHHGRHDSLDATFWTMRECSRPGNTYTVLLSEVLAMGRPYRRRFHRAFLCQGRLHRLPGRGLGHGLLDRQPGLSRLLRRRDGCY